MPLLIVLAIGSAILNAPRLLKMLLEGPGPYDGSGREPRR